MKIINGNYTCIKRDTKLVLIGINILFREWQYLSFQKIYSDIFVQSNYSRYFLNYSYIKLKTFYINKESFTNPNIKIWLYSSENNAIIFDKDKYSNLFYNNKSNIYLIKYDMINDIDEFKFQIFRNNMNDNFIFEIRYLIMTQIFTFIIKNLD